MVLAAVAALSFVQATVAESMPRMTLVAAAPVPPVAPVSAMPTENCLVIVISPSTVTGMVTRPAEVNDVLAVMVSVGAVVSVFFVTVMPVGAVIAVRSTLALTCSEPHMAMTCVVQLPAFAAVVVPGKVYPSEVRMTE